MIFLQDQAYFNSLVIAFIFDMLFSDLRLDFSLHVRAKVFLHVFCSLLIFFFKTKFFKDFFRNSIKASNNL